MIAKVKAPIYFAQGIGYVLIYRISIKLFKAMKIDAAREENKKFSANPLFENFPHSFPCEPIGVDLNVAAAEKALIRQNRAGGVL